MEDFKRRQTEIKHGRIAMLLDILSKMVSRVLNERLLPVVEHVCSDSEVGFRRGLGTTDAVFTVRCLLEVWGHTRPLPQPGGRPPEDDNLFLLFIDLSKAFDSVNRQRLWRLLSDKLRAPSHFVHMLMRMHSGMQTRVLHSGSLGPPIPMRTGVRQGSVEGPTLYLLFYTFVLAEWRRRCRAQHGPELGVKWVSSRDGTLREPSHSRRAQRDAVFISDVAYADYTLLVDADWDRFCFSAQTLDTVLGEFGVNLNTSKTEWLMVSGCDRFPDLAPLPGARQLFIRGQPIPRTRVFKYLGSLVGADVSFGVDADVQRRIGLAWGAFGQLKHVWASCHSSRAVKAASLRSCVAPVLLYGSEPWTLRARHLRALNKAWFCFIRQVCGVSWVNQRDGHVSFAELLRRTGLPSLHTMLYRRIAGWFARRTPGRSLPYSALVGSLPHRVCPAATERQRFKGHYTSTARLVLQRMPSIDERVWARSAQNRDAWRRAVGSIVVPPPARRQAPVRAVPRARRNRRLAPGVDPLKCFSCPYIAKNAQGLSNHIQEKHPVAPSTWTCRHCGKVYRHKGYHTMHEAGCPADPAPAPAPPAPHPDAPRRAAARTASSRDFVCSHRGCGMTFVSLSQKGRHERTQCLRRPGSGAVRLPNGNYVLRCPDCDKTYDTTRALGVHKAKAHA